MSSPVLHALGLRSPRQAALLGGVLVAGLIAAWALMQQPAALGESPPTASFWWATVGVAWLAAWTVERMAALDGKRWVGMLTAGVFGLWIVYFWQVLVVAFDVPRVLLPAPSFILESMGNNGGKLWGDFVQTVVKAVLIGWTLGCALGFAVAVAIDRMPFLQRGLLPVASLTSAIPLVGVAPIAVMLFGFEWPSKAAVIVLMTFFPMLVSTLAGLKAAGRLERELMYSYAASYTRTLLALRLPTALPFIFSALKVNATLALIGAIVAEFFGSPTMGLGFRISTEAARMNMPLVWGAIVVAAVTGSAVYAVLVAVERRAAFWHPSVREG
jgi:NitT/TauT family transport system permease protein